MFEELEYVICSIIVSNNNTVKNIIHTVSTHFLGVMPILALLTWLLGSVVRTHGHMCEGFYDKF